MIENMNAVLAFLKPPMPVEDQFGPATFAKYKTQWFVLLGVWAVLRHHGCTTGGIVFPVSLGVILPLTEVLKQSPQFTFGFWSGWVTWMWELHTGCPLLTAFFFIPFLNGLYNIYILLEPHLPTRVSHAELTLDDPRNYNVFLVAFAIFCVFLVASGPLISSLLFIAFMLTYTAGFAQLVHAYKHNAPAAAAVTPAAGGKGSVIISDNTVVGKFWVTHMVGKNLTEKMDLAAFTESCQGPRGVVRNNQILSLFKAKLQDAGYTITDRRAAANQVPAPKPT